MPLRRPMPNPTIRMTAFRCKKISHGTELNRRGTELSMNLVQKFPEFCAKFIYRKSLQNLETVWGEGRGRVGLSGFVGGGGRETPGATARGGADPVASRPRRRSGWSARLGHELRTAKGQQDQGSPSPSISFDLWTRSPSMSGAAVGGAGARAAAAASRKATFCAAVTASTAPTLT